MQVNTLSDVVFGPIVLVALGSLGIVTAHPVRNSTGDLVAVSVTSQSLAQLSLDLGEFRATDSSRRETFTLVAHCVMPDPAHV